MGRTQDSQPYVATVTFVAPADTDTTNWRMTIAGKLARILHPLDVIAIELTPADDNHMEQIARKRVQADLNKDYT